MHLTAFQGRISMDDRSNTIAGWVLAGGIAALGLSVASGMAFHSEAPEKPGYAIQGVETGTEAGPVVDLGTMMAAADMSKGEGVFKKCTACHTIAQGGANGIGPNLWATLGEGIGQGKAGYAFSDALKSKGGNWTFETMDAWLANPKKFAPGTKMTFAGLGNPEERASLLLYLNSQGSSLPLPSPVAAAVADAAAAEGAAAPAAEGGAAPADAAKAGETPTAAPAM
jgi:cytochrome c